MRLTVRFWEGLSLALALASLPCIAARAADETANVAVRYHCAGRAELTANTNLVVLNKILSLPSTLPFRNLVLHRVSEMLASGLNIGTNAATTALLQPLLTDVLKTQKNPNCGRIISPRLSPVRARNLPRKVSPAGDGMVMARIRYGLSPRAIGCWQGGAANLCRCSLNIFSK